MNTTIRNLIFDLGGVLYNLDVEGCLQAFEQAGLTEVRQLITGTNEAGIFQAYEIGEISTPRFREEARKLIGNPRLTDEEIDRMWNRMLVYLPQEKLNLLSELGKQYNIYQRTALGIRCTAGIHGQRLSGIRFLPSGIPVFPDETGQTESRYLPYRPGKRRTTG